MQQERQLQEIDRQEGTTASPTSSQSSEHCPEGSWAGNPASAVVDNTRIVERNRKASGSALREELGEEGMRKRKRKVAKGTSMGPPY